MKLALSTLFLSASAFAQISGNYVEARTADVYTGPCFANSESSLTGKLAVMGWSVTKGSWEGVQLDGLSVVGVIKASNTLGDLAYSSYPVKGILIVDENANPEQRLALMSFAKHMGGDLLTDIVKVDYSKINLSFADNNLHSMAATLKAGNLAEIKTRALAEGDQLCHNEVTWYPPLTKLSHAMPVYTMENNFHGSGLGTTWSSPDKRSAFIGTFAELTSAVTSAGF